MRNPDPRALPWVDRCPTGHGLRPGPLVAPAQHPRLPFRWKRTPARHGRKQESHQDFLDLRIYPKSVPRDFSQNFSIFLERLPVGFYPWSRSDLCPDYAQIVEAFTIFQVPPRVPDSRRCVYLSAVIGPSKRSDEVPISPHPGVGVASRVALGLPGRPPKMGVTRYPSRGSYLVFRDPSPVHTGARLTH